MVELKEDATITQVKKAPAQKTPKLEVGQAVDNTPLTSDVWDAIKKETSKDIDEANAINKEAIDEANQKLAKIESINNKLLDKLKMDSLNNVSLIVPKDAIERIVKEVIEQHGGELAERVIDAEDMLHELTANKEAIDRLGEFKHMSDRLDEVEYGLDDKLDCYAVQDEISDYIGDYLDEYEIKELIDSKVDKAYDELESLERKVNTTSEKAEKNYLSIDSIAIELITKVDKLEAIINRPNVFTRIKNLVKRLLKLS